MTIATRFARYVVLERVKKEEGCRPRICVIAIAHCVLCDHVCYMGDKTTAMVAQGAAAPLCQRCAARVPLEGVKLRIEDHVHHEE